MNHLSIVRIFSFIVLGFASLLAICFLVALATGETRQLIVFAGTSVAVGGLASTVIVLTDKPSTRAHARDGLAVVLLFWSVGGLISAIPFLDYLDSADFLAAFYESKDRYGARDLLKQVVSGYEPTNDIDDLVWRESQVSKVDVENKVVSLNPDGERGRRQN